MWIEEGFLNPLRVKFRIEGTVFIIFLPSSLEFKNSAICTGYEILNRLVIFFFCDGEYHFLYIGP